MPTALARSRLRRPPEWPRVGSARDTVQRARRSPRGGASRKDSGREEEEEQSPLKIYFETDSRTLEAEDSARIQRAAEYLKSNPGAAVDITGFADKTGSSAANEELAEERAQTVRGALVAAGVPEARTTLAPPSSVTGGGNDREARRVEIRLKSS